MRNYICKCEEGYILRKGEECPFCFVPKRKKHRIRLVPGQKKAERNMKIMVLYITTGNMAKTARELGIDAHTVGRVVAKYKTEREN